MRPRTRADFLNSSSWLPRPIASYQSGRYARPSAVGPLRRKNADPRKASPVPNSSVGPLAWRLATNADNLHPGQLLERSPPVTVVGYPVTAAGSPIRFGFPIKVGSPVAAVGSPLVVGFPITVGHPVTEVGVRTKYCICVAPDFWRNFYVKSEAHNNQHTKNEETDDTTTIVSWRSVMS